MKVTPLLTSLAIWFFLASPQPTRSAPPTSGRTATADSNFIPADSLIFCDQFAILDQSTIFYFMGKSESHMSGRSCAEFYRQAHITKYFQLDGEVVDRYVRNDRIAGRLVFKEGELDGPCVFYHRNGTLKERGSYVKNEKTGIWEYYYENGQKAKVINFTDSGMFLIEHYSENGKVLVRDGNGVFRGKVTIGKPRHSQDAELEGSIKNGALDGEWKIFNRQLSGPANIEYFDAGRFIRGTSYFLKGTKDYNDAYFSSFESVAEYAIPDQYHQDLYCWTNHSISVSALAASRLMAEQLDTGFKLVLKSNSFSNYSGWVFVDMTFDRSGTAGHFNTRFYERNDEFDSEIHKMLDHLKKLSPVTINGAKVQMEKFCVVLVDANQVVIPEAMLDDQVRKWSGIGKQ
jgi:hypothetical protein